MRKRQVRRQHGVSLTEVLVSMVVLSIGLLGLAGLQVAGLKGSYSAMLRAQAAQYANDMADRMRANLVAARAGAYARTIGAPAPGTATAADADVTEWLQRLASLPSGDGAIATSGNRVTIVVQWDDRRGAAATAAAQAAAATATFVLETELWTE